MMASHSLASLCRGLHVNSKSSLFQQYRLPLQFNWKIKRDVLKVTGKDALRFLQNLTTNNVGLIQSGQYTSSLNGLGKIVFEGFLYKSFKSSDHLEESEYLLEVEKGAVPKVLLHFNTFLLRDKVYLDDVSDQYDVILSSQPPKVNEKTVASMQDDRAEWSLNRAIVDKDASVTLDTSEEEYNLLKHAFSVPEGRHQCLTKEMYPFECNIDLMNGINYDKGCYLGQEIVARTHFRGAVRKRVMSYRIYKAMTEENIDLADWKLEKFEGHDFESELHPVVDGKPALEVKYGVDLKQPGNHYNIGWASIRSDEFVKTPFFALKCRLTGEQFLAEAIPHASLLESLGEAFPHG